MVDTLLHIKCLHQVFIIPPIDIYVHVYMVNKMYMHIFTCELWKNVATKAIGKVEYRSNECGFSVEIQFTKFFVFVKHFCYRSSCS